MRSMVMSATGALALLASVSVCAQTPPPDSVTEVLRQKPRQGMVQEYEASRKKHMAWHKAQNDTWAWDVFEITTGPDTGGYLIASGNHQWKEMEEWDAKLGDADGADSAASMGATIDSTKRAYLDAAQLHQPTARGQRTDAAAHRHLVPREAGQ